MKSKRLDLRPQARRWSLQRRGAPKWMSRAGPIIYGNSRVIRTAGLKNSTLKQSDNCRKKLRHRALPKEQPIALAIGRIVWQLPYIPIHAVAKVGGVGGAPPRKSDHNGCGDSVQFRHTGLDAAVHNSPAASPQAAPQADPRLLAAPAGGVLTSAALRRDGLQRWRSRRLLADAAVFIVDTLPCLVVKVRASFTTGGLPRLFSLYLGAEVAAQLAV
jgi:hypothetical protein